MATPTTNLTMQNWFETTLSSPISGSDTAIPLNNVPTGVEGFLIIEPDSSTNREVIFYTSKTASQVNCSSAADGRGQDGTSAIAHSAGATVRMNFTTGHYTALKNLFTTTPQGWTNLGIAQSGTIVHNGNRSYTVPFASDVSGLLTPGMRLLFNKTVAGNGYMGGAFNGTSQYFTKTSPSGTLATVTDNFTLMGVADPTSYATGYIAGRFDATYANGLGLFQESTGQISIVVNNGGSANYRKITSYQSVSLTKKTTVFATWASGTVKMYFDGVSVPIAAAVTGGTAPTTAGTGGDFSIGRPGAYNNFYFPGYISNVAVFNAVLSAATIASYNTYKLTGSETNCIGAWSLDNTANDQFGANNLTATGGVGYTAMTPHGQLDSGVQTTKAVALVMAVNGTTVTCQTPEGCTIPTTGGVSAVAYSTQANPYGWVSDKGRWELSVLYNTDGSAATSTSIVQYGSRQSTAPIGAFEIYWTLQYSAAASGAGGGAYHCLSRFSSTTISEKELESQVVTVTTSDHWTDFTATHTVNNTSATTYYHVYAVFGAGGTTTVRSVRSEEIRLTPSNL